MPRMLNLQTKDQSWWDRFQHAKRLQRSGHNPLINSSFQALQPCPCGNGTPELAVLDDLIYFGCMTKSGNAGRKSCRRITSGIPMKRGARWEAAQQWNDLVNAPDAAALIFEAEMHTAIPQEEEWLERHWSRQMGQQKVQRGHRKIKWAMRTVTRGCEPT